MYFCKADISADSPVFSGVMIADDTRIYIHDVSDCNLIIFADDTRIYIHDVSDCNLISFAHDTRIYIHDVSDCKLAVC